MFYNLHIYLVNVLKTQIRNCYVCIRNAWFVPEDQHPTFAVITLRICVELMEPDEVVLHELTTVGVGVHNETTLSTTLNSSGAGSTINVLVDNESTTT